MILNELDKFGSAQVLEFVIDGMDVEKRSNHHSILKWNNITYPILYFLPINKIEGQYLKYNRKDFVLIYELSDEFHEEVISMDPKYKLEWVNNRHVDFPFNPEIKITGSDDLMMYLKMKF